MRQSDEVINGLVEVTNGLVEVTNGLRADVARLDGRVDDMARGMTRMNSRIGNGAGDKYERRMIRRFAPILRRELNANVVEVLHEAVGEGRSKLMELTEAAELGGRISGVDGDDLEDVDLAALLDVAGGARCAAAEISITADQGDISRAVKRATTLGAVTGEKGLALVICADMSESNRRLAAARGVVVITRGE